MFRIADSLPFLRRPESRTANAYHIDHRHRDLRGGAVRAGIFGVSDGLITNVSIILGVAGAGSEAGVVRLAALAGLVAGAFSMAAGEYVSMTAQKELLERELDIERRSLAENPEMEQRELASIYRTRGLSAKAADDLSNELMKEPATALEAHARDELGLDPNALGSPTAAALSSFVAFAIGGLMPLVPWFFADHPTATVLSIVVSALAATAIGAVIGISTGRGPWGSALRQLGIGALAGAVTYGVGALLGVEVS
jgi:VIT1/CCC1 family predicted Fe2+/Mn2+ transporter